MTTRSRASHAKRSGRNSFPSLVGCVLAAATGDTPATTGDGGDSLSAMDDLSSIATTSTSGTVAVPEDPDAIELLYDQDLNDHGNGGDSDTEGDLARGFFNKRNADDDGSISGNETNETNDDNDDNNDGVVVPNTPPFGNAPEAVLQGAPLGWIPPMWEKPDGFKPAKGAPSFDTVDNPGQWPEWLLSWKGSHFETPAGAQVVPKNDEGKRMTGDYEAHYQTWASNTTHREGAKPGNIRPIERRSKIDRNYLVSLAGGEDQMTQRIKDKDFLFFFQLLLPIADPELSGIDGDCRMPFFSKVSMWTNAYAILSKNKGTGVGHTFKNVCEDELLRWMGCVIRDASLGGNGNIYLRWQEGHPYYDEVIAKNTLPSRWRELKSVIKLNQNLPEEFKGKIPESPSAKFDYIFKTITENINAFTESAHQDQTIDETTYGFGGYGPGMGRVKGKRVNKGGQTVMMVDADGRYMRAYHHRLSEKFESRTAPFNQQGPHEVSKLVEKVRPLIKGMPQNIGDKRRQIFLRPPHLTFDNYFSGEHVAAYLGRGGFGAMMTMARNRVPPSIDQKFLSIKKQLVTYNAKVRGARYLTPVTFVRDYKEERDAEGNIQFPAFQIALVSFQSTGSTNFMSVNSVKGTDLYCKTKTRGRGDSARSWGIEMNQSRETYLETYGGADHVDHEIEIANIFFVSWKYWHAPFRHAIAMAVVFARHLYMDCATGAVDTAWRIPQKDLPTSLDFRLDLSKQMLEYRPRYRLYPGDERMRVATQQHVERRTDSGKKRAKRNNSAREGSDRLPTIDCILKLRKSRLCNQNYDQLKKHFKSVKRKATNSSKCVVCGKLSWHECGKCGQTVHVMDPNGAKQFGPGNCRCFLLLHDETFCGLARCDSDRPNTWEAPTQNRIRCHARDIRYIVNSHDYND